MEYYRIAFSYERFIDYEWDYTIHNLKSHKENLLFTENFINDTGLHPTKSPNNMYFFVDCTDEQAMYIKIKYQDIIISEEKIKVNLEPVYVNK